MSPYSAFGTLYGDKGLVHCMATRVWYTVWRQGFGTLYGDKGLVHCMATRDPITYIMSFTSQSTVAWVLDDG